MAPGASYGEYLSAAKALQMALIEQGLVLCKPSDTSLGLDGDKELEACKALSQAVETGLIPEVPDNWDQVTKEVPTETIEHLKELSRTV